MQKIVCGICSFGMSGRVFHCPLISAHSNFHLSAVIERKHKLATEYYPDIRIFKSMDDLLSNPEIDLVVVNVPDHLHASFCRSALEAGKHVVVEKPFTLSVKEGQALIDLAEERKLGLFVFQNRRWDSDFLTIRKIIESRQLGRIVEYEAHFDRYRPNPPTDTWKEDEKLGPGLLYNLGAHLIDQALVLFGWPDSVYADIKKLRKRSGIIDYFNIILSYPDNLTVILKSSYLVKKEAAKYIIHGEKGSFLKSGDDPQEERLKQGWKANHNEIGIEPSTDWGKLYTDDEGSNGKIIESLPGNYMRFYDDVYNELTGQSYNAVSAEEGLQVIRIIEASILSQQSGKKINTRN